MYGLRNNNLRLRDQQLNFKIDKIVELCDERIENLSFTYTQIILFIHI